MSLVHLHLLLNHVPVIGTLFVLFILVFALWRRNTETGKLALGLLVGVAMVTAVVFLTGEPAEEAVENVAGVSETLIHEHEDAANAALAASGLAGTVALVFLLVYRGRELARGALWSAFGIALLTGGLMARTANLGGQIRHSEIRSSVTTSGGEAEERDR